MTQIIADFCSNHLNDRRIIEDGIRQLAEVGVDYVKFQTFTADKLNPSYPNYDKMLEYYKSVELSKETHIFIIDKCKEYGIKPLFTAFGTNEAYMLQELGINTVKIASPDAGNVDLLYYCHSSCMNMFISTGMSSPSEIQWLRKTYRYAKYFYCISKYPTEYADVDFDRMMLFDGFSDHTQDIKASLKAIDLGMDYIERHFTLGKFLPGKDHKIASTPDEFKKLVDHRNYLQNIQNYKSRWRS